jgi:hypothetical protein
MENLDSERYILREVELDLKDAYMTIPVHPSLLKRRRSLHVNVRFKKSMWMFKWYMNIMFIFDSLLLRIQCPFSHILL